MGFVGNNSANFSDILGAVSLKFKDCCDPDPDVIKSACQDIGKAIDSAYTFWEGDYKNDFLEHLQGWFHFKGKYETSSSARAYQLVKDFLKKLKKEWETSTIKVKCNGKKDGDKVGNWSFLTKTMTLYRRTLNNPEDLRVTFLHEFTHARLGTADYGYWQPLNPVWVAAEPGRHTGYYEPSEFLSASLKVKFQRFFGLNKIRYDEIELRPTQLMNNADTWANYIMTQFGSKE